MMWTRKELKDKAKVSFRANYWKAVFVALIAVAITIWAAGPSSMGSMTGANVSPDVDAPITHAPDDVNVTIDDGKVVIDVDDEDGGSVHLNLDSDDIDGIEDVIDEISHDGESINANGFLVPGMILAGLTAVLFLLVFITIALAIYAFVFNPLEVGCMRFFVRNLNQRAEVKELAFAYDNNYLETVKTLFMRDLFIFLWCLLLIVPGIYKAYEYRMIPYLMADDPTMTKDRAFSESKRMMDGQKWNAFVLDLSFLGWNILSLMTLGILGVFYVDPYQEQTNAALYEKLRYGLPAPEQATQAQPWQPTPFTSAPVQPMQSTQPMQTAPYGVAVAQTAQMGRPIQQVQPTQPVQQAQAAPFGAAPAQPVQTVQMAQVAPTVQAGPLDAEATQVGQPTQTASNAAMPDAWAQAATVPTIATASQPPIPPFAAVGYEPADEVDEIGETAEDNARNATELESTDSPEA